MDSYINNGNTDNIIVPPSTENSQKKTYVIATSTPTVSVNKEKNIYHARQ